MDLDLIRDSLRQRRDELTAEIARLAEPPPPGSTVGFGKRVGDGTTEAVERLATTATARSLTRSLNDVERAIAKIDEKSYGVCDDCGADIDLRRIEALPAVARCLDCSKSR